MHYKTQIGLWIPFETTLFEWHVKLNDKIAEFNRQAEHINVVNLDSIWTWNLGENMDSDLKYAAIAAAIGVAYCSTFLGSFSPIHCRFILALVGVFLVIVGSLAGFGICLASGWYLTDLSNLIPVLMCAIGIDDMFVICNAVD